MNERLNMRLFLASGHLSPEAVKAYASGELRGDLMTLAGEHMAKCMFCRQAVQGLILSISEEPIAETLADLNRQIRVVAKERQGGQVVSASLPRGTRWAMLSAAAALLVGLLFSFYFIKIQSFTYKLNLAEGYKDVQRDYSLEPYLPPPFMHQPVEELLLKDPETTRALPPPIEALVAMEEEMLPDTMARLDHDTKAFQGTPISSIAENLKDVADRDEMLLEEVPEDLQELREIEMIEGVVVLSDKERSRASKQKSNSDAVFSVVEDMPVFVGGMEGLTAYLEKNLRLPSSLTSPERKVIVGFVVDEKGRVRDPEIIRGMNDDIDKEVLRVVKRMPNWIPGQQRGKPVRTRMTIPVHITPNTE